MPRDRQDALLHECEIHGFLEQSHISAKNIARLQTLTHSKNARIAELAILVSDIARLTPHRRRRIKMLARTSCDVLQRMENAGLIGPRLAWDDVEQYDVDPIAAWYECVDEHEFPSTHESPTDAPYS